MCVCLSVSLCFVIYPVYCLVSFSSNLILWSTVFVSIGLDMSEDRGRASDDLVDEGLSDTISVIDTADNGDPRDARFRPSYYPSRNVLDLRSPYGTRSNVSLGKSVLVEGDSLGHSSTSDAGGQNQQRPVVEPQTLGLVNTTATSSTPSSTPETFPSEFARAPGSERGNLAFAHAAPGGCGRGTSVSQHVVRSSTSVGADKQSCAPSVSDDPVNSLTSRDIAMSHEAMLTCMRGMLEGQSLEAEYARKQRLEEQDEARKQRLEVREFELKRYELDCIARKDEEERKIERDERWRREDKEERLRQEDIAAQLREDAVQRDNARLKLEEDRHAELEREKELKVARENMKLKLQSLSAYTEKDNMATYLSRFEDIMSSGRVDQEQWESFLAPNLPTKFASKIKPGVQYNDIKAALLSSSGETVTECGYRLLGTSSEQWKAKSASDICEFLYNTVMGFTARCDTVDDTRMTLWTMLSRRILPSDGLVALESKTLKTFTDVTRFWEDWLSTRHPGNFFRPRVAESSYSGFRGGSAHRSGNHTPSYYKPADNVPDGSNPTPFPFPCFHCGKKGHRMAVWPDKDKPSAKSKDRQIVCHLCGTPGHKSPDCPKKKAGVEKKAVKAVRKKSDVEVVSGTNANVVAGANAVPKQRWNVTPGHVNGKPCNIVCDTGAEVAVVPRSLVGFECNETGPVVVCGFDGNCKGRSSAIVKFVINGKEFTRSAVISEEDGMVVVCSHMLPIIVRRQPL